MSLNGLDDERVKAAHEAAVAEPGGWFLLKYASRDEVELLGRGNGGIVEIRNNIAQYEDKSPLYGFLRYRRRNVIIKYLPEDCSRLIQARVTVHFDEVCDRFSPHDTTFSIADSKELKDTKLSAACSLHAASGSTSSSTSSLRRRRLMEITEEEEEEERERKRQSVVKEEDRPKSSLVQSGPPIKLDAELAHLPGASQFGNDLEPPQFMGVPRPSSPAKSFDESSRRMSSQSSRTTDLYPSTTYPYSKPRVKLGPRPSADPTGRPRSAGGSAHRVATVPAGLKSMSKGPRKGRSHSQSQDDEAQEQAEDTLSLIEIAEADTKPSQNGSQPQLDSATDAPVDTMPPHKIDMPAPAPQPTKKNTMTPEKARLLKAMKLREKKLMSPQPTLDVPSTDIPSAPSTPGLPDEKQDTTAAEDVPPVNETSIEGDAQKEEAPATNSDSAIDVGTDHASVDTAMDSHPASPAATSEIGDSTQASSLSDSTDETILAKDEQPINENEQGVAGDDNKLAASIPEERIVDTESRQHDNRESQATITVPDKEDLPTPPEPQVEQPTVLNAPTGDALPETSPTLAVSEVPAQPGVPENDTSDVTPTEVAEASAPTSGLSEEAGPVSEEKAPLPQIHIPLSKFSTQETKSPTATATQGVPSIAAQTSDVDSWRVVESAPPVPEKDDVVGTGDGDAKRRKLPDRIQTNLDAPDDKRRSVISILDNDGFMDELQSATVQQATPITVSKSPISPFFGLDQPSKRPGGGPDDTSRYVRTVSNPVRNSYLGGEVPSGPVRSASSGAAYLQKPSPSDVKPKNAKLGSSISQRIKALEKLSVNAPGVETVTTPKERPASTFFAVRKTSVREGSRPSSVAGRTNSMTRGVSPSPPASRDSSSPEATRNMGRGRSGSLVNRLSMFEGGMPPRGRPESVQVTARIVRDPNQRFPKGPEPKGSSTEYGNLDLKQSPLLVDVQNRTDSRSPVRPPSVMSNRTLEREIADQAKQTLLERRLSKQSRDGERDSVTTETTEGRRPRRRSSLSVVKDFIKDKTESMMGAKSPSTDNGNPTSPAPTGMASPAASRPSSRARSVNQPGSLARRLSVSSRRSSIEQSNPNMSVTSLPPPRTADLSAESDAEAKLEKRSGSTGPASPKSNRASRFMRRLSNTLVTGRKTTAPSISPTVAEENAAEVEAASRGSTAVGNAAQASPSIVAFMGDVNVQFPDNLLWKRRSICLDNQGFLILSAVQGTAMMPTAMSGKDRHGAMVKRYHMSDFKAPYAPDVELQELPNSVVLDLVDGSGLQIACVDRAGQMSILHILEEAHHNHSNF